MSKDFPQAITEASVANLLKYSPFVALPEINTIVKQTMKTGRGCSSCKKKRLLRQRTPNVINQVFAMAHNPGGADYQNWLSSDGPFPMLRHLS